MRCKCCDADDAKWWDDDWYCNTCKQIIVRATYDLEDNEEVDADSPNLTVKTVSMRG